MQLKRMWWDAAVKTEMDIKREERQEDVRLGRGYMPLKQYLNTVTGPGDNSAKRRRIEEFETIAL